MTDIPQVSRQANRWPGHWRIPTDLLQSEQVTMSQERLQTVIQRAIRGELSRMKAEINAFAAEHGLESIPCKAAEMLGYEVEAPGRLNDDSQGVPAESAGDQRNPVSNEDALEIQKELFEIIVKAGRRCAYDLHHAARQLRMADQTFLSMAPMFEERADLWLTIFNPANGPKDYRNQLHAQIDRLESDIYRLESEVARLRAKAGESEDDSFRTELPEPPSARG